MKMYRITLQHFKNLFQSKKKKEFSHHNIVNIREFNERPVDFDEDYDFEDPNSKNVSIVQNPDYYLWLLAKRNPGLLTAEFNRGNENVDWIYYDYLSEDDHISFTYKNPIIIDQLHQGLFRPILARIGNMCIGKIGLYGGHSLFRLVDEKNTTIDGLYSIFMSNFPEIGYWIKIYKYAHKIGYEMNS